MEEKDIIETTENNEQAPEVEAPVVEEAPVAEEPKAEVSEKVAEAAVKVDAAIDSVTDKVLGADDDGKKLSIAALVLGILGIVGGWIPVVCYFTTVCAILGVIFGVKGRKKSIAAEGKASGLATAGLVLGIIGVVFAVLGLICTVICSAALCAAGSAGAAAL